MKNYEIIANEAIAKGLYTKEEVEAIFSTGGILPLYTYQELKRNGYQIRKGEKSVLQCKIWNYKQGKKEADVKEDIDGTNDSYYMHKASFFKIEQADKMEESNDDER